MTEEQQVVNQGEANTASDQEQFEQVQEQVESEISTTDGKNHEAIAKQLSRDIIEKNRKIQELKSQLQQTQQTAVTTPVQEDETVKRFIRTEALTMVNNKMLTDTTFKDRAPIVSSYIEQGYTFDMADKLAKADIMDKLLAESSQEQAQYQIPKQITPKAIPEPTVQQSTGNVLDDIEKGLVDAPPELAAMLSKYRSKG